MKEQDWKIVGESFIRFCKTVASLRHPETGCPWDLEQDHRSLREYMIEEAYEAAEVMNHDCPKELCEELGDVLLQVVLNAQIAKDNGNFEINQVIDTINDKMIRRHPHVFGSKEDQTKRSINEIKDKWQEVKASEKDGKVTGRVGQSRVFHDAYRIGPASLQAEKIGKIAAKNNFDWQDAAAVFQQLESEMKELAVEVKACNHDKIRDEIGDVFFSLVQLCRHYKINPELNALEANQKFLSRFALVEGLADAEGKALEHYSRDGLETLWQKAKEAQKKDS